MSLTIFPRPKQLEETGGKLSVTYPLTVALPEKLASLEEVLEETVKCEVTVTMEGLVTFTEDAELGKEAYHLNVDAEGIGITYAGKSGAYYALVTLGQILGETVPCCRIEDEPALAVRGYMIDISRGKVPTLEDLCRQIDRLAAMKYNQVQG